MSIIQQIREKAGWFVFILIGLSLLGFLLMDAFVGNSGRGLFGGNSSTIGSINGSNVDAIDYQKRLKMMEDQYAASGYPVNEMMRQNIQEQVWNQYVDDAVLTEETGKVGLSVPAKELDDILFGANPPQDLKQQFTNDRGEFDVNAAKNAIANLRKQKNNPVTENFNNIYLPALMQNRMREKYSSLLGNSFYVPKWIVEKLNADNSQRASIKYVNISYSSISDSTADVKVSDSDISDYVSKHKDEYKQDASRTIAYVVFNAAPTAADTNQVIAQSEALRNEYAGTTDPSAFLVRNGSDVPYFDGYVVKSKMQVPNA
jgi:peptidyl-prolyl cis-trans isomerase D